MNLMDTDLLPPYDSWIFCAKLDTIISEKKQMWILCQPLQLIYNDFDHHICQLISIMFWYFQDTCVHKNNCYSKIDQHQLLPCVISSVQIASNFKWSKIPVHRNQSQRNISINLFNTRDFAHFAARAILPSFWKHKYSLSCGGDFWLTYTISSTMVSDFLELISSI